jgi:hypothetical protein
MYIDDIDGLQSVMVSTNCVKHSRKKAGLGLGITPTDYHCSHVSVPYIAAFASIRQFIMETSQMSPKSVPIFKFFPLTIKFGRLGRLAL